MQCGSSSLSTLRLGEGLCCARIGRLNQLTKFEGFSFLQYLQTSSACCQNLSRPGSNVHLRTPCKGTHLLPQSTDRRGIRPQSSPWWAGLALNGECQPGSKLHSGRESRGGLSVVVVKLRRVLPTSEAKSRWDREEERSYVSARLVIPLARLQCLPPSNQVVVAVGKSE